MEGGKEGPEGKKRVRREREEEEGREEEEKRTEQVYRYRFQLCSGSLFSLFLPPNVCQPTPNRNSRHFPRYALSPGMSI